MVTRPPAGEEARGVVPAGRGGRASRRKGDLSTRQEQSGALTAPAPHTNQTALGEAGVEAEPMLLRAPSHLLCSQSRLLFFQEEGSDN